MSLKRILGIACLALVACASRGPRSAEQLRDAYADALEANDPAAAYALLDASVQATLPFKEFEQRWNENAKRHTESARAIRELPKELEPALAEGTTVHTDGRVLHWTRSDGRYYVTAGLPGSVQTTTPAQTVRALIAAVRTTDMSNIRQLLGEDLAARIGDDWTARAEAMEAALERPGAIELTSNLRRAELRYEPSRILTLEQTPAGWRVIGLE